MKVFAFLVSLALFLGGLALFGYAFTFSEDLHTIGFFGGIVAVSLSLMIPFHLLERLD
ncbi:hypothetical protein [Pseudolysinimonas yzui]|uniref:Uncharacterized protein n=1 Tax=Pseudolysinimonas yzui TaxID=2708254 RepID=A0A8J3GR95_9MICO|nr:hypothetical protein [Pseudolysinimonas yzui]GHF17677.1 hypothetical protein GCM10011600_18120 [Pseudolysinimonas yzui]